jgi:hypothetical protein
VGANSRGHAMNLTKRKNGPSIGRWATDENKTVHYEFEFKNKKVVPGTTLTLKYDRTRYKFVCYVHDIRLDRTWLELISPEGFKSATIDRVSKVYFTTKKSRAKKHDN